MKARNQLKIGAILLGFCLSSPVFSQVTKLLSPNSSLIHKYNVIVDTAGWLYFSKRPRVNDFVREILRERQSLSLILMMS
jgi:hypothetical protein